MPFSSKPNTPNFQQVSCGFDDGTIWLFKNSMKLHCNYVEFQSLDVDLITVKSFETRSLATLLALQ